VPTTTAVLVTPQETARLAMRPPTERWTPTPADAFQSMATMTMVAALWRRLATPVVPLAQETARPIAVVAVVFECSMAANVLSARWR
jgi:hypothetical protein